jgi:hypothetical protein
MCTFFRVMSVVVALLFSPFFATDSEAVPCDDVKTTVIYYGNGVGNTYAQANYSRMLLYQAYKSELQQFYPEQRFVFKIAYNHTRGVLSDVVEVIGQKLNEIENPAATEYAAAELFLLYMAAKDYKLLNPAVCIPVATAIEEYFAGRLSNAVDALSHIQKYSTDLQEGARVLLIAHSQGNLYANQALGTLLDTYPGNIGMIGVASPAGMIHSGTTYHTAHDDRVIDALRLIHEVIPSNVENDPGLIFDPRDISCHAFGQSYFSKGLASRDLIDDDLWYNMEILQFPEIALGSGAITVTMTWGEEPDVDLHAFEPNGSHVYYSNRVGLSGHLDRDDRDGYGPEHYYVACSDVELGAYNIGVNYFRGSGPERATFQITTADGYTQTIYQQLDTARGSDGNDSPVDVARITVNADGNGGYEFGIE